MSLPTLLIPIEIKAREFRARLMLAGHAAAKGHKVLIGSSSSLHAHPERFPVGVILENDATAASMRFVSLARSLGFGLAAWDEESIAVLNDDWYVRQRINEDVLANLDIMFCRGQRDAAAIAARYPTLATRLRACGNPRLDILRPETGLNRTLTPDAPIVVMSRFSRSNPFSVSRQRAADNAVRKFRFSPEDEAFYREYLDYTNRLFDLFFPFVGRLAKRFPDQRILVRPHPSENYSTWEALAGQYPNMEVDVSGSAEEMARHAKLVIHNGCTTGIEAALLGTPVFSYMPISSERFDVPLPNSVSQRFAEEEDLFGAIHALDAGPGNDADRASSAWKAIEPDWVGDGSGRTSVEIILQDLQAVFAQGAPRRRRQYIATARAWALGIRKSLRAGKAKDEATIAYKEQKFTSIERDEILSELAAFGFRNFTVLPASTGWWSIAASA